MPTFTKPSLSITDQIALLENRGLIVDDRARAEHCLMFVSYYRLRAYWYYFEVDPSARDHTLKAGTTLDDVLALYEFDRRLRLLVNDGIERIEVAARGSWAHALAMGYGPHGYEKPGLYRDAGKHRANLQQLDAQLGQSRDGFITHYDRTYGDPPRPPVWMVAEIVTFGLLSKLISSLASRGDRNTIARPFGFDERFLTSFLHHLVTVRNVCAHHGRLWNRRLTVTPAIPSQLASSVIELSDRRLYNTLAIMLLAMEAVAPACDWKQRLTTLLGDHPSGDLAAMGFPDGWQALPIWAAS